MRQEVFFKPEIWLNHHGNKEWKPPLKYHHTFFYFLLSTFYFLVLILSKILSVPLITDELTDSSYQLIEAFSMQCVEQRMDMGIQQGD